MFGYIKIFPEQLTLKEANAYRSMYCGLCHQIAEYSQIARLFLSFDMVFFTILSAYDQRELAEVCVKRKCLMKHSCPSEVMDYWAAMSILIIYQKILNDAMDGELIKKIYVLDLERAYSKAKTKYPKEERHIATCLNRIDILEKSQESNPEILLDIFGDMMGELMDCAPCESRTTDLKSILRRIGENISKWLYAMDFYDDLKMDKKKGHYNPLLTKMNESKDDIDVIQMDFKHVIEGYVAELQRLCSYLPYEGFHDIVTNVLHEGVIHITSQVYSKHENEQVI